MKNGPAHGRCNIRTFLSQLSTVRTIFTLLKSQSCTYPQFKSHAKCARSKPICSSLFFRTRKLYQKIDEYANENIESAHDESLNTPDVDMPCLVKVGDSFNRGKIVDVCFDFEGVQKCDLKVFLVDTGETVTVDSMSVFEIPDNLVEMCPYQVNFMDLSMNLFDLTLNRSIDFI